MCAGVRGRPDHEAEPAQKRKYLGQIKDGLKALRDAPGIGARRDDIRTGLRAQSVPKHVIFYRVTKSEVVIVRVLHESMNPELHLKPKRDRGGPRYAKPSGCSSVPKSGAP